MPDYDDDPDNIGYRDPLEDERVLQEYQYRVHEDRYDHLWDELPEPVESDDDWVWDDEE